MARVDREALLAAAVEVLDAKPDPEGTVDLVYERGSVIVAATPAEIKAAFKRIRKIDGYRWVLINREDLFAANPLSIGSKAGILDAEGKVLKNADAPRRKL